MRRVYKIYYYILYPIFWILFIMRPKHRERVIDGPALICANHSAYTDIMFLSFAFGRKHYLRYVAKKELLKIPVFGWLLKKAGVIGIDRGNSDITAIREVMRSLKEGYKVVIFPEGTRMQDDSGSAKNGAIMIASKTGVPIIPAYIPRTKKLFTKISVIIGEPYRIEKQKSGSEAYGVYADELMSKISSLHKENEIV